VTSREIRCDASKGEQILQRDPTPRHWKCFQLQKTISIIRKKGINKKKINSKTEEQRNMVSGLELRSVRKRQKFLGQNAKDHCYYN